MQNLRKCSNRHYFIPYKIINLSSRHDIVFKHGINTIFNLRYINANGNIKLRRLPVLERHHIVNKAHKKCGIIKSTLLDYSNNQCKLLSYRNFSTSSSHNKEEDNNKSSKNNDSDPVKYIILSILKIGTVLGFLYFIGKHFLLIPKESTANVSWQEFVQEMLAKGEVEELIVYPSTNVVKINLYPEAIIKGQKLLFRTYTMHIPNIDQIEEKLRKEERKLGIKKKMKYQ